MISCTVCQLEVKNGDSFVAAKSGGLIKQVAHANCAPQDHVYDGLDSYLMNEVRAVVVANHLRMAK